MNMPGFCAEASLYTPDAPFRCGLHRGSQSEVMPQSMNEGSIFGQLLCGGGCIWDYLICTFSGGRASDCEFEVAYCMWACRNPLPGPIIL